MSRSRFVSQRLVHRAAAPHSSVQWVHWCRQALPREPRACTPRHDAPLGFRVSDDKILGFAAEACGDRDGTAPLV
jgi:hypothetical protein